MTDSPRARLNAQPQLGDHFEPREREAHLVEGSGAEGQASGGGFPVASPPGEVESWDAVLEQQVAGLGVSGSRLKETMRAILVHKLARL
jgi:hypothetical protein